MWDFPVGSAVKNPPVDAPDAGDVGLMPCLGRSPEKEMATCSRILACKIPWTKQPGGYSHIAQITYTKIKIYIVNN